MRAFKVSGVTPQRFVERVEREIEARNFGQIATVSLRGDRLIVTFSWMGTSSLEYRLVDDGGALNVSLLRQKMSPFHAPFKAGFDDRFDQVLSAVGAEAVLLDT